MPLQPGTQIGPYTVLAPLGAGGMGEVYRARDGKLNRDVAIKVLPDLAGRDPERLARFEREAHVLASLNHPNIAAIYGIEESAGAPALILELVEGPTLADRIAAGPIPCDETLAIARQIAGALEAAHALGIIHRDLKPANVKLRPDDAVKVLDFGLAKAFEPAGTASSVDPVHSPTFTAATQAGVVLGTAAYMAPEQARGRPVDKRADIWAFGCVLFECLTGRQAFAGDTVSDIVAAILTREPDFAALPPGTPRRVREILRRCLQRDPKQRMHDIADVRIALEEDDADAWAGPDARPAAAPRRSPLLPWGIAAACAAAAMLLGWHILRTPASAGVPVVRVAVNLPSGIGLGAAEWPIVALSPDGTRLAITGTADGVSQLYLRRLDRDELTLLPGTRGATRPFFSPDGRWIAFTAATRLKKVALDGGLVVDLCQAGWGGGTWGRDGRIIFTREYNSGLWSVPDGGGTPQQLTVPDKKANELGHWWPQILPDGKTVIFTSLGTPIDKSRILARSLESGQQQVLLEGATFGRVTPSGQLLFARTETVMAAPFDAGRVTVTGPGVPIAEGVLFTPQNAASQFAVSDAGMLAFIRTTAVSRTQKLVTVDRKGTVRILRDGLRSYGSVRLSPDGRRVALGLVDAGKPPDIWIFDVNRGSLSRFTFGPASNFNPVWTPDGSRIIYSSERPVFDLYAKPADSGGDEQLIATTSRDKYAGSVSPDGRVLLGTSSVEDEGENLLAFPLTGGGQPEPFLVTARSERAPVFSPDGRWVAYSSDESDPGVTQEIYLRSYPGGETRHQVSTDGGNQAVWARSGRELFYRAGRRVMRVPVAPDGRPGTPSALFEFDETSCETEDRAACYDVSLDGQQFYMLQPAEPARAQATIELVLNAFAELNRLAR